MGGPVMIFWIAATALVAGLSVWFATNWLNATLEDRRKTETQRRQDRIESELAAQNQVTFSQRIAKKLYTLGWQASPVPLAVATLFGYFAVAVVLSLVGLDGWLGVAIALPVTAGIATAVASTAQKRRQRLFNRELLDAFDQFAANVRTAASPAKAIELQVDTLPEPIRSEMVWALDQHGANRPLADAMSDVADRYPSRAMTLFVSALRINEQRGGRLADALEQAAASLRKETELSAEATAEVSQEKMQFFGIVALMAVIAVVILRQSYDSDINILGTPVGVIGLLIGFANFGLGIFRTLRLLNKAKGGQG